MLDSLRSHAVATRRGKVMAILVQVANSEHSPGVPADKGPDAVMDDPAGSCLLGYYVCLNVLHVWMCCLFVRTYVCIYACMYYACMHV
jgi:hypothetical protein